MIDLTPLEVRQKKDDLRRGGRSFRGYATGDVDVFLDLVAERMEQLVKENMALADRAGMMETQLREYRERERGLTEALVAAQELREQVGRQALQDAELTRREAELDAARIQLAAAEAREREEAELWRLRARRSQLLHSYRAFLERELAELQLAAEELERAGAEAEVPRPAKDVPEANRSGRADKPAAPTESPPDNRAGGSAEVTESDADWLASLPREKQ